MKSQVIINADDLGLSTSVTKGIIHLLERGLISDISLIPCGTAFEFASDELKRIGRSDVGVHLTLVDSECPLSNPSDLRHLTFSDGMFFQNRTILFRKALIHFNAVIKQVRQEWTHQIEKVLHHGFEITHLDSHQHLHLFPGLSTVALELARSYTIPFIRVPRFTYITYKRPVSLVVNVLSKLLCVNADRIGIRWVRFAGLEHSGMMNLQNFITVVSNLVAPVTEIGLHPGYVDSLTKERYRHWNFRWQEEFELFAGSHARELLSSKHLTMIRFKDLL